MPQYGVCLEGLARDGIARRYKSRDCDDVFGEQICERSKGVCFICAHCGLPNILDCCYKCCIFLLLTQLHLR